MKYEYAFSPPQYTNRERPAVLLVSTASLFFSQCPGGMGFVFSFSPSDKGLTSSSPSWVSQAAELPCDLVSLDRRSRCFVRVPAAFSFPHFKSRSDPTVCGLDGSRWRPAEQFDLLYTEPGDKVLQTRMKIVMKYLRGGSTTRVWERGCSQHDVLDSDSKQNQRCVAHLLVLLALQI